jgi:PadR family transcriptional regulator PadR
MIMKEMREPTWFVLTALAGGRRHGYGIIQEVGILSDGRLNLRAGTLYAALDRLVGEGLVTPSGEEVVDGRLRRYYELTIEGRSALAVEANQRTKVSREALSRLRLTGGLA